MVIKEKNIGSSLDAFLREQGIAEAVHEQSMTEIAADLQRTQPTTKAPRKSA